MAKLPGRLAVAPIRLYQRFISPLLGPRCRYYPSCSHYTKDALLRHGLAKGVMLGLARILRCNPLFAGGFDHVPHVRRWGLLLARIRRDYRRFWSP
jgi:putative membrane protein insertion efficiency factor